MVEIIYENKDWLQFFEAALTEIDIPYRLNNIEEFELDLNQPPDDIVYLNRISPSSHTPKDEESSSSGEIFLGGKFSSSTFRDCILSSANVLMSFLRWQYALNVQKPSGKNI